MTIVSRIFATAALFSLALVSSGPGPVSALSIAHVDAAAAAAAHRARALSIRRSSEDLNTPQRRCKARPSSPHTVKPVAPNPPVTPTPSISHSTSTSSKARPSSSSSSSYAPVASPKPPANPSGGKVGLAWSNGEEPCLGKYVTSKTKYLYTWDAGLPNNLDQFHLQGARMLWGDAPSRVSAFRQLRESGSSRILMGMNEPNEPSQSNMKVEKGIALWNAELRPFRQKGYTLVSPAVTNSPVGTKWMDAFFAGCGTYDGHLKCGVDIVAIHYYGVSAQEMISFIEDVHNRHGLHIWVTEFACQSFSGKPQCTKDQIWRFMETVVTWMDSTYFVDAYFAFGIMHSLWNVNDLNRLMAPDCSPTTLGEYYINA